MTIPTDDFMAVMGEMDWYAELELIRVEEKKMTREDFTMAENYAKAPIATGVLDYFPAAIAEVARVSLAGNLQHNGDTPLIWSRDRGRDQENTLLRHFLERGSLDTDGIRHSAKLAWRALALLQLELEKAGAPIARGARLEGPKR